MSSFILSVRETSVFILCVCVCVCVKCKMSIFTLSVREMSIFILCAWNVKCLFSSCLCLKCKISVFNLSVRETLNFYFYLPVCVKCEMPILIVCAWNVKCQFLSWLCMKCEIFIFILCVCVKRKLWNVYFYPVCEWTKNFIFLLLLLITFIYFYRAGPSKRGMSAVSMVGTSGDMTPNSSSPISAWSQPLTSHLWPWPQGTTLSGMREMEREGGGKGEGGRECGKWQPTAQEWTLFKLFQHGGNSGDIIILFGFFPFLFPPWSYMAGWDRHVNLVSTLQRLWCLNRLRDKARRGNGRGVSAVGSKQNQARMVCGWRPVSDVFLSSRCVTGKGTAGIKGVQCQCCGAANVVNQHKS